MPSAEWPRQFSQSGLRRWKRPSAPIKQKPISDEENSSSSRPSAPREAVLQYSQLSLRGPPAMRRSGSATVRPLASPQLETAPSLFGPLSILAARYVHNNAPETKVQVRWRLVSENQGVRSGLAGPKKGWARTGPDPLSPTAIFGVALYRNGSTHYPREGATATSSTTPSAASIPIIRYAAKPTPRSHS